MEELKFERIDSKYNDIPLPSYATEGSAGMDIMAAIATRVDINAGETKLIPTNLKVDIPKGYELQVRPRSGMALKYNISVLNSPGTIDEDYKGPIGVILHNYNSKKGYTVYRGDKIAQLVLAKSYQATISETKDVGNSSRGEGGFGSTGK